jgi:hypothetical protein
MRKISMKRFPVMMVVLLRYPRLQVDRQKGETEVEQDEFVCGRIVILIKII